MIKHLLSLVFCFTVFFSFISFPAAHAQEEMESPREEAFPPLKPETLYDGVWITRYKNNNIRSEGYHKYGKYNGPFTSWYENGQKQMEGQMVNGRKIGRWIIWNSNGTIKVQEYYRNGKRVWRKEFK